MEDMTFSEELRKLTTEDRGHADVFNPLFQALLANTLILRKALSDAETHIQDILNDSEVKEAVMKHIQNMDNPHSVSKSQIGLEYVENYGIATNEEAKAGIVNNKYLTPYLAKVLLDAIAPSKTDFSGHTENTSNPHSVSKSQVGLGSVLNYGIATTAQAKAGTIDTAYMTPIKSKQQFDGFIASRDTEIENLKTISVNGKQMIADAINGVKKTSLTSATTYEDLAYYISQMGMNSIFPSGTKGYKLASGTTLNNQAYSGYAAYFCATKKKGNTVTFKSSETLIGIVFDIYNASLSFYTGTTFNTSASTYENVGVCIVPNKASVTVSGTFLADTNNGEDGCLFGIK